MYSKSENDGLSALLESDLSVLSVGISTGGEAEAKMLRSNPERKVVATTLDREGIEHLKSILPDFIKDRLELRCEDISNYDLDYEDEVFDYVYARLVLHYLSADSLNIALKNIHRVLKKQGRLFVVVRSINSPELKNGTLSYDVITHLTTYKAPSGRIATRYFHTKESITDALEANGFTISGVEIFDEDLSPGFIRDSNVRITNNLIEVFASKS